MTNESDKLAQLLSVIKKHEHSLQWFKESVTSSTHPLTGYEQALLEILSLLESNGSSALEDAVLGALDNGARPIRDVIKELKEKGTFNKVEWEAAETVARTTVRNLMERGVVQLDADMKLSVAEPDAD